MVYKNRFMTPSDKPVEDAAKIRELKVQLDTDIQFSKANTQYIEAAHKRLENGLPLSMIESQVVAGIVPLEPSTVDSE